MRRSCHRHDTPINLHRTTGQKHGHRAHLKKSHKCKHLSIMCSQRDLRRTPARNLRLRRSGHMLYPAGTWHKPRGSWPGIARATSRITRLHSSTPGAPSLRSKGGGRLDQGDALPVLSFPHPSPTAKDGAPIRNTVGWRRRAWTSSLACGWCLAIASSRAFEQRYSRRRTGAAKRWHV